jgi:hypothetical protein
MKRLALALGAAAISSVASAAGIDSRSYTCGELQSLVASRGFVFISQATFGDFVVANDYYCQGGSVLQTRSVATRDSAECPVNYCVSAEIGRRQN